MTSRATLVLVHGAWHGAWCWERLTPRLERLGVAWRTLDLPSIHGTSGAERGQPARGLNEDAAAVRSLIDRLEGSVVVCGHSYGGMVISLAAAGHERVAHLVYLAAFVPEAGQSLVDARGNRPAAYVQALEGGLTLPDPARAGDVFYGDCDPATREWALARLAPQPAMAFTQPVPQPAWREIASTYIVCKRDKAIAPQMQREVFAPRARERLEIDASHSPFLSQPEALAEALAQALSAAAGSQAARPARPARTRSPKA